MLYPTVYLLSAFCFVEQTYYYQTHSLLYVAPKAAIK